MYYGRIHFLYGRIAWMPMFLYPPLYEIRVYIGSIIKKATPIIIFECGENPTTASAGKKELLISTILNGDGVTVGKRVYSA